MSFRSPSKGGALRALARRALLAPLLTASLLVGSESGAVILGAGQHGPIPELESAVIDESFDGIGQIQCRSSESRAVIYLTTGWVMGSSDTVVTAAHSFYKAPESGRSADRTLDPGRCVFVLYDRDQAVREIAAIRYAVSPWADVRRRDDSSYDFAVLKLDRPVKVKQIPVVRVAGINSEATTQLIAFHSGLAGSQRARITHGIVRPFPASQLRNASQETRITNAARMFSTSADSTPGSSGGMYYDARKHAAVGLHVGSLCDTARPRVNYDPDSCFNYGLRFDAAMVTLIEAVVGDRPAFAKLVIADGPEDRLALVGSDHRGS